MKKIVSMFLALVMALALAAPAFASSGKVDVAGSINLPTINVVLPTTASVIANPYKLDVKLNPKDTTETPSNDQIISPLMVVKNLSNTGVQVGATVQGVLGKGSDATFAAASAASSTDKDIFIYAKFKIGDADMGIDDIAAETTSPTSTTGLIVILDDTAQAVDQLDPGDAAAASVSATGNVLAGTNDAKNPDANGVLGFRFFGDMGKVTTWTDKDTVSATIAFTFTPTSIKPAN